MSAWAWALDSPNDLENGENRVRTIREGVPDPIMWKGKWEYILFSGVEVFGRVRIGKDTNRNAVAECADGSWRFKKTWLPFEKVTLLPVDFDVEVAIFRNRRIERRALLTFPYGQRFYWRSANFWLNKYLFTDLYGEPLLCFKRNSNPFTALVIPRGMCSGCVKIEPMALSLSELPLLVLLGCYLMVIDAI